MKKLLLLLITICGLFISCESTDVEDKKYIPDGFEQYSDNSDIYVKNDVLSGYKLYIHNNLVNEYRPAMIQIGVNDSASYLVLTLQYKGEEWIFFNSSVFANANGERLSLKVNTLNKKEDMNSKYVYESVLMPLNNEDAKSLLNILNCNDVYMRFGGKHTKDYTLDAEYIRGLKEILEFYFDNFSK